MATRKTYQRQFLGPRYSPSPEAEMGVYNQAQSGMSALSQNLNQMTNFFFKEMQTRAVEEGEIYGATNPITMDELEKAARTGEDVTGRLGYGLKGKAARSTAFASVISEIELEASRDYTAYIENAKLTQQDPQDVIDGLDSITLGYTSLLKKASPENYGMVKGALSKLSNGVLKGYINDIADIAQQQIQSMAAVKIEGIKSNLGNYMEGELDPNKTEQQMINDLTKLQSVQTTTALSIAINEGKYTGQQTSQLIKDLEKDIIEKKKGIAINQVLKTGTVSSITSQIVQGKKTNNPQINALIAGMTTEDKNDLVKKMYTARQDEISFEKAIDESDDENSKTKFAEANLAAFEALDKNDITEFNNQLNIMRAIDPDDSKIFELERKRVELGGRRLTSNPVEFNRLQQLEQKNILDFDELNQFRGELSKEDYDSLFSEVEKDKKFQISTALRKVEGLQTYNPEQLLLAETKESKLYAKLSGGLKAAAAEAQNELKAFDVNKWLDDNLKEQQDEINEAISSKLKTEMSDMFSNILNEIKTLELPIEISDEFSIQNYEELLIALMSSKNKKIKNYVKGKNDPKISASLKQIRDYRESYGNE
tara:strand:- start:181 stop:1968 length:1788 start_codon:yes stop_codon:yes gene_type:complete